MQPGMQAEGGAADALGQAGPGAEATATNKTVPQAASPSAGLGVAGSMLPLQSAVEDPQPELHEGGPSPSAGKTLYVGRLAAFSRRYWYHVSGLSDTAQKL